MVSRRLAFVLLLAGAGISALALSGCSHAPDIWEGKAGPPRVVVSIPPLYSFVQSVGGEHVGVVSLCTNTGPHHYGYSARDALALRGADGFFAIGLVLDDHFTGKALENCGNPRLKGVVKLGDPIEQRVDAGKLPEGFLIKDRGHRHSHKPGEKHHEHGELDPHIWVGLPQAIVMVEMIRDHLVEIDAAHASDYRKNASEYIARLNKLHEEGKAMLKGKENTPWATFHESLAYFAKSFDLQEPSVIRDNPGTNPTSKDLQNLVEKFEGKIKLIAVEPQYPREGPANVIVEELKKRGWDQVQVVELDPLETAEESELAADWYEKRMRANLETLQKHLP